MATSNQQRNRHTAGLFDIRNIIGLLLLIYGIALLIMGVVATSDSEKSRAGGINANLWSGIVMGVVGVLFLVWAYTRPTVVPADVDADDGAADGERAPTG